MLKRLWIVLSIIWAAVCLTLEWQEHEWYKYTSTSRWPGTFALALAPLAVPLIARWVWAGRKRTL